MREIIDIGANLGHNSFDADRAAVLQRAAENGVTRLIVTGTSVTSSVQALALTEQHPGTLFATAGVHPHHAAEFDDHSGAALERLLGDSAVVAVGECGLDFFRDFSPRPAQRRVFRAQLEIAAAVRKPVFLHQRDSHAEFLEILAPLRAGLSGGVAHCFTGGRDELAAYLDLDLYIGVTGWVCDERRGTALRDALPMIPLDRLLLETDAPYLLPRDLEPPPRGRRNEPAFLAHILERVAAAIDRPADEVASAATANAVRLFGLPTPMDGRSAASAGSASRP
jgi:TatD DNase family protein